MAACVSPPRYSRHKIHRRSLPVQLSPSAYQALPPIQAPLAYELQHYQDKRLSWCTTTSSNTIRRNSSRLSEIAEVPLEQELVKMHQNTLVVLGEIKQLADQLLDAEARAESWQRKCRQVEEKLEAIQIEQQQQRAVQDTLSTISATSTLKSKFKKQKKASSNFKR